MQSTIPMKTAIGVATFILLFSLQTDTLSQIHTSKRSREGPARQAINQALQSWRGGYYEANDVVDIDSLKGDMRFFLEPLEDPYGTLADCFMFTTRIRLNGPPPPESQAYLGEFNAVGVFRGGNIVWISDTTILESSGRLLTTRDINDDGVVEILTEWNDGRPYVDSEVWIHSWNGNTGWRINAVRDQEHSVIEGPGTGFGLFDAEGDGILEIKNITVTDGSLTYSWNGQEYGTWPNTPHLSEATWLPRNNFTMTIACHVQVSGRYEYSYTAANASTSRQRIDALYLEQRTDSADISSPPVWQRGGVVDSNMRMGWDAVVMSYQGHILPGQSRSGFNIASEGLPAIVHYAAQAYNTLPRFEMLSDAELEAGLYSDIANNAVWGRTIGPADPPSPFNSMNFLDTIKSYINESRSLGWITSQSTADKYAALIDSARSKLQASQVSLARLKLDTVLTKVHQDSATTLSSEAYALLMFNTEYVLSQLPVVTTYTLSISTVGDGSVTRDQNYPVYDSASTVQLTAIPDEGSYFIQWSGGASGSENPLWVVMNSNKTITATFKTDAELAEENQTSSLDATATNNARHLAKTVEFLHEVFVSGGEVFYRRSGDGGSSWDQTYHINDTPGENSHPGITVLQTGSIHIVWQHQINSSTYEVLYTVSRDDGETWSTPVTLPNAESVSVSEYQTEGTMPVIAGTTGGNLLLVVYCSESGLAYAASDDDGDNWRTTGTINGQYNDRVRYPSLVGDGSKLWLAYDYVNDAYGPYSRTFDGSTWSDEVAMSADTDTDDGAFTSISIDPDGYPLAAWEATSANMQWGRAIVVCLGYPENKWSKWFTVFGQNIVSLLKPSVTYYEREGDDPYGAAIINHTSQNHVKLIQLEGLEPPTWNINTLSESGAWAGITQEISTSGTPYECWTDQSSFPYQVVVGSSAEGSLLRRSVSSSGVALKHSRAAVVKRKTLKITLEVEPMKFVRANGDTMVVPFKRASLRQRNISLQNVWDYLGTDTVRLPSDARRLVLTKRFTGSITQRKFSLRLLRPDGTVLSVLDTISTSGTVSLDITLYAGTNTIVRPQVILTNIETQSVDIGIGDIFIEAAPSTTLLRERKR